MNKQFNKTPMELTDEQAIDAIYGMFGAQRQPFQMQSVGQYGIVNPGAKDFGGTLLKLNRKTRTREDEQNHVAMADIIDRDYADHDAELLDKLSDWSRFAIILPDYASAPATVGYFLGEFGGEITFHERPDYQAIHLHTNYKSVNLEFQFHSQKHAELKKATDIFYHEYNNIPLNVNSLIDDERKALEQKMIEYCQTVYRHSDFNQYLPAVKEVVAEYQHRTHGRNVQGPKLKHFCQYARKAEMVQNELAESLVPFLARLNQMDQIKFDSAKTNI